MITDATYLKPTFTNDGEFNGLTPREFTNVWQIPYFVA